MYVWNFMQRFLIMIYISWNMKNIMHEKDTQMVLASSSFENATKVRLRDWKFLKNVIRLNLRSARKTLFQFRALAYAYKCVFLLKLFFLPVFITKISLFYMHMVVIVGGKTIQLKFNLEYLRTQWVVELKGLDKFTVQGQV